VLAIGRWVVHAGRAKDAYLSGPYFKKIGNTYYMRKWDKAEAPGHK
jgi:hypothetical protein